MPTYDYRCQGCATPFEAHVESPRSRPACPRCRGRSVRRLPCAPAIRGESPTAPILPTRGASAHGCGAVERPDGG